MCYESKFSINISELIIIFLVSFSTYSKYPIFLIESTNHKFFTSHRDIYESRRAIEHRSRCTYIN